MNFFHCFQNIFKLLISNQTLEFLDDLELSVLEELRIFVVILPQI